MNETADIVIVGSGPGGMQAALVLARTRKKIVVFDAPAPPRNNASHGVHNFLGLDGMLPAEIRALAWTQIRAYPTAELREDWVMDVAPTDDGQFVVTTRSGAQLVARTVILAQGFKDIHPEIDGFEDAWADTIIPCPFCDGYENRDRVWGLVISNEMMLSHLPKMTKNWTSDIKIILTDPDLTVDPGYKQELIDMGMTFHRGEITSIKQKAGKLESVMLDGGEVVSVGTLWWVLPNEKAALTQNLIENSDLALDERGNLKVDDTYQTSIRGLYAIGDVLEYKASAMGAATAGHAAASAIVHSWYQTGG